MIASRRKKKKAKRFVFLIRNSSVDFNTVTIPLLNCRLLCTLFFFQHRPNTENIRIENETSRERNERGTKWICSGKSPSSGLFDVFYWGVTVSRPTHRFNGFHFHFIIFCCCCCFYLWIVNLKQFRRSFSFCAWCMYGIGEC